MIALENIVCQKEKDASHYNQKVKWKCFQVGDLVWKVILPIDRKSKVHGKLSPNWDEPYVVEIVFIEILMQFAK